MPVKRGWVLFSSKMDNHAVAFASRTLSPTEQRYATIEKECLVIVFGCKRFNQYVARREKISVVTDHKPLESIFKKSLLSVPCRLQRMLLRLQRYNLSVRYTPGSQMFLADHLSRAAEREMIKSEESFQVFSLELENTNPMHTLKVTPERLDQLQRCTGQDEALQTLKTTILTGWPGQREQVPISIREYWSYREELTIHNDLLFKGSRVIIPRIIYSSRSRSLPPGNSRHSLLAQHECRSTGSDSTMFGIPGKKIRNSPCKVITFLIALGAEWLQISLSFMTRNSLRLLTSFQILLK